MLTFKQSGDPLDGETVGDINVTAGDANVNFSFTEPAGATRANPGSVTHQLVFTASSTSTEVAFTSLDTTDPNAGPHLDAVSVREVFAGVQGTPLEIGNFSVADIDAGTGDVTVNFAATNGTITVSGAVAGGVAASDITNNETASVTLTGTVAEINATLASSGGVSYTSNSGFSGLDTVTVTVNDLPSAGASAALSDVGTVDIFVQALNLVSGTVNDDGAINGTAGDDLIQGLGTTSGSFQGDQLFGLAGDDTLVGENGGSELFYGGDGDDTIVPGTNNVNSGDYILGSLGNDRVVLNNASGGYVSFAYGNLSATMISIAATINFNTNTASIVKTDNTGSPTVVGTDTIEDINNLISNQGADFRGTQLADTFNITGDPNGYVAVLGGRGNDVFNLQSGLIRLEFRVEASGTNFFSQATQAANVDLRLASNQIINDGLGFTDNIIFSANFVTGSGNRVEIRGTDFTDTLIGDDADNRFIGEQGNDTIDGQGGVDLIRFDRSGAISAIVDLDAGTATGFWDNTIFNYTISNLEDVRGTNVGVDKIFGSSSGTNGGANRLEGRGGVDVLNGRLGNDTLVGGDDHNVFVINQNSGNDTIEDFVIGLDRIVIVESGLASTASFATFTFNGSDTFLGADGLRDGGDDQLFGDAGFDNLQGGVGNDILVGGADADTLIGGDGDDIFRISSASDSSENDSFIGGNGNDTIQNTSGANLRLNNYDSTTTGSNNNGFSVENIDLGGFSVQGSTGQDTTNFSQINFQNVNNNLRVLLVGDDNDTVTGTANTISTASGITSLFTVVYELGTGNDNFTGSGSIFDIILGGDGADTANTGAGNDLFEGGLGQDNFTGGSGADTFAIVFDSSLATAPDAFTDFDRTQGDRVDISGFSLTSSSQFAAITFNATFNNTFFNFGVNSTGGIAQGVTLAGDLTSLSTADIDAFFIFDTIAGTTGNDNLNGTGGDDYFRPDENDPVVDSFDTIFSSAGDDTIDYSFVAQSFQSVNYTGHGTAITFNLDVAANTASVDKGPGQGTDTFHNIVNPLNSGFFGTLSTGGFNIRGTAHGDTFNLNNYTNSWMSIRALAGADSYQINGDGFLRLEFLGGTNAANIDLSQATNQIADDGFGNMETITGTGSVREIRGTNFADTFIGSTGDESFIPEQGNDNINGGAGGFDRLRYDRSNVDNITADLNTGTVSGVWDGVAFTHTVSNIDWVRGSLNSTGGGGADRLEGEGGNDTLSVPDAAFTTVDGGDGVDILSIVGGGQVLDFSNLGQDKINSIETINLGIGDNVGGVGTQITLNEQNVIDFSVVLDPVIGTLDDIPGAATGGNPLALSSEALLIDGDTADQVTLANKATQGSSTWQLAGNDIGYNVYNYTDGFSTFASVAIDGEVAVVVA